MASFKSGQAADLPPHTDKNRAYSGRVDDKRRAMTLRESIPQNIFVLHAAPGAGPFILVSSQAWPVSRTGFLMTVSMTSFCRTMRQEEN